MSSDMTNDVFAEQKFGRIAIEKMSKAGDLDVNFRLYEAGWLGERDCMKVTGAIFRKALSGTNKGKLSILVKGIKREAFVTAEEMER